mmetsp:Transcript_6/g.7  ORF Transcript_6/g.7 Transcript_6/m.7 type:complete len:116 (+) Transcript_6:520-867(+)
MHIHTIWYVYLQLINSYEFTYEISFSIFISLSPTTLRKCVSVVPAGSIIFRQRGLTVHPGKNVGVGKDNTLFATKTGVVQFSNGSVNRAKKSKRIRKIAHIIPAEPVAETNVEQL